MDRSIDGALIHGACLPIYVWGEDSTSRVQQVIGSMSMYGSMSPGTPRVAYDIAYLEEKYKAMERTLGLQSLINEELVNKNN